MTQINLLPWREEIRIVNNRVFYAISGVIVALASLIIFAFHHWTLYQIAIAQANRTYIQAHENTIEKQVREIRKLDAQRSTLVAQIKIIHALQGDRVSIVKLFNDIVHAVPQGLHLNNLSRVKDKILLSGATESNSDVSNFISNLNSSKSFSDVTLTEITRANEKDKSKATNETLSFKIEFRQKADDKRGAIN